ncbi:hypothetical protein POWCR01_110035000 [Plasmodium ovale]|uniref:Uncharacterized protein n=1 Tax=Plasmodium ovale TaxID=36330 RepID=A0A1C3KUA1_PLAOA|nr:hypothetical protein POWCR01_110035000 [Plasmodium ovale]
MRNCTCHPNQGQPVFVLFSCTSKENAQRIEVGENAQRIEVGENAQRIEVGENAQRIEVGENAHRIAASENAHRIAAGENANTKGGRNGIEEVNRSQKKVLPRLKTNW